MEISAGVVSLIASTIAVYAIVGIIAYFADRFLRSLRG